MMLNGIMVAVETNHSEGRLRQLIWAREVPAHNGWGTVRSRGQEPFSTSAEHQYPYPVCDISYTFSSTVLCSAAQPFWHRVDEWGRSITPPLSCSCRFGAISFMFIPLLGSVATRCSFV